MTRANKRIVTTAAFLSGALFSALALGADIKVTLSGDNEVPVVKTQGSGRGMIRVSDDGVVSGSVDTTGVLGTMAHIHMAAPGSNGPVIIPLTKTGDTYKVPDGARLNADQMTAFKAGNLYVNVHSPAHPGGEVRAQLK